MSKNSIIFYMCLAMGFIPGVSFANNTQLAQVRADLHAVEKQNVAIQSKVKKSDVAIEKTKKDLINAARKLDKLEEERGELKTGIQGLDARREKLLKEISENQGRLASAAAGLIIVSRTQSFDTDNAREYVLTSSLLSGVANQFDSEMKIAVKQIKELSDIRDAIINKKEKLDNTAKKYSGDRAYLDKLLRNRQSQNENLRGQQYTLQKQMTELSDRAKSLSDLTSNISRRAQPSVGKEYSGRRLRCPVSGSLVLGFGEKSDLGLICDGWRIKTRSDALVTAPADGIVEFSDSFRGHKRVLILAHKNGYYSVLTGLSSTDVMLGQEVLAGEPIGRMPDERSEMYMELRRGSHAVDPARMFAVP